jgi:hypothetical protein
VRLSAWLRVEALINARNHLLELRDNGRIELTISGHYQSREFVEQVTPSIRLELRHKIIEVEAELRNLGVTID